MDYRKSQGISEPGERSRAALRSSVIGTKRMKALSLGALLMVGLCLWYDQKLPAAPRQSGQRAQAGASQDLNMEGIRWLDRHTQGRTAKKGASPRRGRISYGGYMPEALAYTPQKLLSSASLGNFHQVKHEADRFADFHYIMMNNGGKLVFDGVCRYPFYRQAIERCYGVPLSDATYFSVTGTPNSRVAFARAYELAAWMVEASVYGEPTVSLEFSRPFFRPPAWKDKIPWPVFAKQADGGLHPEMEALKCMALELQKRKIMFRVRFLSEANLVSSPYSAARKPGLFTESARLFLREMPANVKVVFSPVMVTNKEALKRLCQDKQGTLPFHIIGGTLYARPQRNLTAFYNTYYQLMRDLYEKEKRQPRFQICELGAPVNEKQEVLTFLAASEQGKYPSLDTINFFGSPLRHKAHLGAYGFIDNTSSGKSYLFDHFKAIRR